MRLRLLALIAFFAVLPPAIAQEPAKPRLVVLIVFDQMRGDYLLRWHDLFGTDGFRRLLSDGAWFQNCHYPYAMTATGPGHASLLTGCSPQTHGIVGNNWYDRTTGNAVYCASFVRYERIPPAPPEPADEKPKDEADPKPETEEKKILGFGAPVRLLAPTVADVLRELSPKSKIVGLSHKDRSAIMPVGQKPDACYWFDKGQFVTSTYYADRLHPWVAKFNEERSFDRWFGSTWDKLRCDIDYEKYSGPDNAKGEGAGAKQGKTFPHPFGSAAKPDKEYYGALVSSPFGNQMLLELACRAIDAEHLGQHDTADLLSISFSSNDLIGHSWGPDSQEVLDTTLRSDLIVRDLLQYLDRRVGKGKYLIALTADHGICPLPEQARAAGKDADRHPQLSLKGAAENYLRMKFGEPADSKTRWIEACNEAGYYLNERLLASRNLKKSDVAHALVDWLKGHPAIHSAYVRDEIIGKSVGADALVNRVQKTLHPDRSGDVYFVLKPYHLVTDQKAGTTHGTPHSYDTHVPLVVFGPGIRSGKRKDEVTPQAIAAIFSHALGIRPPAKSEAPLPAGLFAR